jgi:hypothetical protein
MAVAGGARGRANYDELIKLLLIGDSGEEEEDSWCWSFLWWFFLLGFLLLLLLLLLPLSISLAHVLYVDVSMNPCLSSFPCERIFS